MSSELVNLAGKLKRGQLGEERERERERERQCNGVEMRGVGDEVELGSATELERERFLGTGLAGGGGRGCRVLWMGRETTGGEWWLTDRSGGECSGDRVKERIHGRGGEIVGVGVDGGSREGNAAGRREFGDGDWEIGWKSTQHHGFARAMNESGRAGRESV